MEGRGDVMRVLVHVEPGSDLDDGELDEFTRGLRSELLELEVESADLVSDGVAPPGAKAIDAAVTSISLAVVSGLMPAVVVELHRWLEQRRPRCTIKIEGPNGALIEIPNIPVERATEVVSRWSAEHPTQSG